MLALPPLAAESIFHIGSLSITNTYINSTLAIVLFAILAAAISRDVRMVPRGIQNFFEGLIELMLGYMDQVTGSRKKSLTFMPLVGSLFLFILVSNWLGVFPGIGSIGFVRTASGGVSEFIPLFRPANTDLNMTLAMAVLGVVVSHILGIAAIGFFKYSNKFLKFGDVYKAAKSLSPTKMLTAVVEFGVGLIEVVSEVAKIVSLSLRLFGNVFAGEVLLTVLSSIVAFVVPLPFLVLELLVGAIQAVVFSMLVLVYLSMATMEVPDHDSGHGAKAEHGEAMVHS